MDWKNPKFLKERNKWYQKLKSEGFEEIENVDNGLLKENYTYLANTYEPERYVAIERYYQLAGQLLHDEDTVWEKKWHRTAWAMHTDGVPTRKIARVVKHSYLTVFKAIKRYASLIKAG